MLEGILIAAKFQWSGDVPLLSADVFRLWSIVQLSGNRKWINISDPLAPSVSFVIYVNLYRP